MRRKLVHSGFRFFLKLFKYTLTINPPNIFAMKSYLTFEQGPIRPPSEAHSLLIRTTRGCSWNKCRFCSAYNSQKFSIRTVAEIINDIRIIKEISDQVREISHEIGCEGRVTSEVIRQISVFHGGNSSYMNVAMWLYRGTGDCFLQDGDNLIMKTEHLVKVLSFLRETLPEVGRITTYSRSKTISLKTVEQLREIKEAGLDRVHVGLESGCDTVLEHVKKGATKEVHVDAGRKAIAAGMELSVYVIPGLGGVRLSARHAMETADVINRINPHFIRLRSLRVPERIPLFKDLQDGTFERPSDDLVIQEIRCLIENLKGISSTLTSDHILNILGDVQGIFPEDKSKMLKIIDEYEALPAEEKLIFRLGRRGGAYQSISDLYNNKATRSKISSMLQDVREKGGASAVEDLINKMADELS